MSSVVTSANTETGSLVLVVAAVGSAVTRSAGSDTVEVAAPVSRILHGLDQRRLQQEGAEQAEQAAEDGAEGAQRQAQQRGDDGDHQIDRKRDEQEVGGVALVQRPRLAQHTGERVHALIVRIYSVEACV